MYIHLFTNCREIVRIKRGKDRRNRWIRQCVAVGCSGLQWVAVGCSGLQWVAVCCSGLCCGILVYVCVGFVCESNTHIHQNTTTQHAATHCNTLQHTATHCNTLQHTATHCNTLQHTATKDTDMSAIDTELWISNTRIHQNTTTQHTATHCNTLQHTATHCNTLQQKTQI